MKLKEHLLKKDTTPNLTAFLCLSGQLGLAGKQTLARLAMLESQRVIFWGGWDQYPAKNFDTDRSLTYLGHIRIFHAQTVQKANSVRIIENISRETSLLCETASSRDKKAVYAWLACGCWEDAQKFWSRRIRDLSI